MNSRSLLRGALLIALALVLQALRIILPLPPLLSTLLIGTLVHMMLVLTLQLNGRLPAVLLCVLLPLTAYVQGQLALPILIPVVWIGNFLFVVLFDFLRDRTLMCTVVPPLAKALAMGVAAWTAVCFVQLASLALRQGIMFGMSVMQLITGILGVLLARRVLHALPKKI